MSEDQVRRKLAAILSADVSGYRRRTGQDEASSVFVQLGSYFILMLISMKIGVHLIPSTDCLIEYLLLA